MENRSINMEIESFWGLVRWVYVEIYYFEFVCVVFLMY